MSIIRYRYLEENWETVSGTNYKLETIQPYDRWYVICTATSMTNSEGCGQTVTLMSRDMFSGRLISAEVVLRTDQFSNYPVFKITREESSGGRFEQYIGAGYSSSLGTLSSSAVRIADTCQHQTLFVKANSFSVPYAANRFRETNPGGRNLCKFTVYSGDQVVFERTNSVCPEVEEANQCPEDTCEVTCGDTICCYGSDGVSVANFPRS